MKKKLLIVVCVVVVAGLSIPLINLVAGKPSGTALGAKKPSDAALAKMMPVLEAKCAHCHVPGTPVPYYAKLPMLSGLIARDIAEGLRRMDLAAELFPGNDA